MPPQPEPAFDTAYFDPAASADPYPGYEAIRADGPLHWSERMQAWAVLSLEGARTASRDPAFGQGDRTSAYVRLLPAEDRDALHPLCEHMPSFISFLDPPEHTRQRALAADAFHARVVRSLEPVIDAAVADLLDRLGPAGSFEFVHDFALPLTSTVITSLLGVPRSERERFIALVETIFRFLGSDHRDAALARSAKDAYTEVAACVDAILDAAAGSDGDDLAARFAALEAAGQAQRGDVLGALIGLVQGGFETTLALMSSAVYLLLAHPEQAARVRDDAGLVATAVEEAARCETPLKYVTREAREDVVLEGVQVRAGDKVNVVLAAANRDPAAFGPDAAEFDPARSPNPHMAFGHGIHFCLGAPLARLETALALRGLLARFPGLALDGEARWRDSALLRQLERLPVAAR
jgi:cytochrome P450